MSEAGTISYRAVIPTSLHGAAKRFARQHATSIRYLIVAGLRAQLEAGRPASSGAELELEMVNGENRSAGAECQV